MGILSALLSVFAGPALSDTAKGIAAYRKGNYQIAMQELEKAAASGDEQAYFNLGVAYAEGKAVPQDFAKAVEFYRKGAEGGSVLAAFNFAQSYRKGQGIEQDYAAAAKWYEFGAKRGDFRASNEFGLLYVEGKGVERDLIEGFAWIYPATCQSIMDESAMANAMQLASMLDKQQIDEAQARGRAYFEKYFEPNVDLIETLLENSGR